MINIYRELETKNITLIKCNNDYIAHVVNGSISYDILPINP